MNDGITEDDGSSSEEPDESPDGFLQDEIVKGILEEGCIPCVDDPAIPSTRIVHSVFGNHHVSTVWIEYPAWFKYRRDDCAVHTSIISDISLTWSCSWERNCLKDALVGFDGGKNAPTKKCNLLWTKHLKNWASLTEYNRHSHFPGSWCVGRKDRLASSLTRKKREHINDFNFIPETYILPLHRVKLRQRLATCSDKSSWIRKPVASSQGRGIKVLSFDSVKLMVTNTKKKIQKKKSVLPAIPSKDTLSSSSSKSTNGRSWLIQRYLSRPLLVNDYKFDLRVYVVATSFNPLCVYMFPEGLARFCTEKYSNTNKSNPYKHLTNYSINKKSEKYQQNLDENKDGTGSKWSMSALFEFLEKHHSVAQVAKVKADMNDVIIKTLIAAEDEIYSKSNSLLSEGGRNSCFELYGFDIMIDKDFRVWLVEVNISPSLMTASPLDKRIKTIMICDTLHLVGIPAGPFVATSQPVSRRPVSSGRRIVHPKSQEPKNQISLKDKSWEELDAQDKMLVEKVAQENTRRGHFDRIFPPVEKPKLHKYYLDLFTSKKYANSLVFKFEQQVASKILTKNNHILEKK